MFHVIRVLTDEKGGEFRRTLSTHSSLGEALTALGSHQSGVGRGSVFCAESHYVVNEDGEPFDAMTGLLASDPDGVPF